MTTLSWQERWWVVRIWVRSIWYCLRRRTDWPYVPHHFYTTRFIYNPHHWRLSYVYPPTGGSRLTKVERVHG